MRSRPLQARQAGIPVIMRADSAELAAHVAAVRA
jgi:hypothetical protein